MCEKQSVKDVQVKILEIMKYIDKLCRANHITYYIMGGTALGAVRHGGFIPWDDDLDIFMTPSEFTKFKEAVKEDNNTFFVLQEWKTVDDYLEHAKLRMNGTTLIEENFKHRRDLHQGIYVDIMLLHKIPAKKEILQKKIYFMCKFVTLYALSQRNWQPKTFVQAFVLNLLKFLPCKMIAKWCYKNIYKFDGLIEEFKWFYWITPASFRSGIFDRELFEDPVDVPFEDTMLLGSVHIKKYLEYRYGNYMILPPKEQQKAAVHAMIFDVNKDYTKYIK